LFLQPSLSASFSIPKYSPKEVAAQVMTEFAAAVALNQMAKSSAMMAIEDLPATIQRWLNALATVLVQVIINPAKQIKNQ